MRSLWLEEALAGEDDAPTLEGTTRCDVCIVGGGYTGLWTAIRLKELEPSLDIAVVEQDVCGGGASGRNGGFALTWWSKFLSLKKSVGPERAVWLCRETELAIDMIGEFCAEWAPKANYRKQGWLWTATNGAQVGAWDAIADAIEQAGGGRPFRELSPEEVAAQASSRAHLAGVHEPCCAAVQPAQLARGLRRKAVSLGVRAYEHSRVTSWTPHVRTEHGSVEAETVIVATGAWLGHRNPRMAIISSDVLATEPLDEPILGDGLCVSDSRLMVNYFREHEGRLVWGRGGGTIAWAGRADAFNGPTPRRSWVEECFRRFYPSLAGAKIERTWTGPIDRTKAGVPFFYREGNVVYGSGYSAVGVSQTSVGGRILASLALRLDDDWTNSGLVKRPDGTFPPEPVRFLGGKLVREGVASKERAEDAERAPGAVSRWLASLAPPGFVPGSKKPPPAGDA